MSEINESQASPKSETAEPRPDTEQYKSGYRSGFQDGNAAAKKDGEKDKEGGGEKGEGKKEDAKEGAGGKEGDDKKKKGFHPSPLAIIITVVVVVVLLIVCLIWWHYAHTHVSTDDAYTNADVHQISPRVAGQVLEVWVNDNQKIKKGDLLVKLDTNDFEVGLQRAQANLEQSHAQVIQAQAAIVQAAAGVTQAEASVAQARAQTDQAGARYEVSGIDYGRASSLYGKDLRAVSKADVDTNKSNLDANKAAFDGAKANVQAAEANANAARAISESRAAELVAAKAQVDTAASNVADAKLQLSYCWVLAPIDGRISRKTVETGQRLSAGQSIMAVTQSDVWILANLKETQLENVRVGMHVKIPIDAFPHHVFDGYVDSIQAGSGATYSLLPPDNATGNFTKIVQRVPVKIVFDQDSLHGYEDLVVAGLSAEPVIDLTTASNQGENVTRDDPAPPKGPHEHNKQ